MKISVGICTYNGAKYIEEQLRSIVEQTIQPDEIILTDDCSSDNTVEIAKEILKKSGIEHKIIAYDTHQGILKNFSNCLDVCRGDVIFSSDQDDIWKPNKIETFLPFFEDGCVFVYSNAVVVDANRNVLEEDFWACYGIDFSKISTKEFSSLVLRSCCIAGCNMAFTKELYNKIKPIPYHFLHDGWVAICAPWFGKIAFINEPLMEYRRHGKNVSAFNADVSNDTPVKEKKKNKIITKIDIYRKETPEKWFGDHHCSVTSGIFYDRMKDYVSEEYRNEVIRCKQFHDSILKCLPKHRMKSIAILLKEYFCGNYKLFRGNEKRLIKDMIYLCLNENKDFVHDINKW